ncbi:MAG: tetratricopeptide repeat protein [Planctomycetes bacterium]|nr:tetratricopeptide repeat protein [Planctomycetota bacterium]
MFTRLLRPAAWIALALAGMPATAQDSNTEDEAALREYHSANGLLNRGLYELAADEYHKFLADNDDHAKAPVARYGLAVCLFRLQDYDTAIEELKRLHRARRFQYAAEVATILGQCYLTKQRYAAASDMFREVVDKHSEHDLADDAGAHLAEALYLNGDYEEAIRRGAEVAGRWPKSPLRVRVEFFRALSEMATKNYEAAAKVFATIGREQPQGPFAEQAALLLAQCHHHTNEVGQAVRWYRQVLKQTGGRYVPDAQLGLAMLLQQQGKAAEAGELLDRLISRNPDGPLLPAARLQRGRVWFDAGRFDRARTAFEQVGDSDEQLADDVAYWVAKCKLREGDFEEAARLLEAAIEAHPKSELMPEMSYDRAVALVQAQQNDEAADALARFRSRFGKHAMAADALQLLAMVEHRRKDYDTSQKQCRAFLKQYASHGLAGAVAFLSSENDFLRGRYEQAVKGYRGFLEKFPQDARSNKARYRLGMALYRLERPEEAAELLADVARGTGQDELFRPARLALGDIQFQRGEWKQAEQSLRAYLSGDAEAASADDALLKLGLSLQRQGRHEEALASFERLQNDFRESPHHLQAVFERGQVLVALERLDEAAAAFEQVLAKGGDSRFAPYVQNHLGAIALKRNDFELAADRFANVARDDSPAELAAEALFQGGQALMAAKKFKGAREVFAKLLEKHPAHDRAAHGRAQLAIALSRLDRHEEALKAIAIARRGLAQLSPSERSALQYEKAWCLRQTGKSEQATAAYRELLRADGGGSVNLYAMLELAEIEAGAKRYAAAAKLLRQLRKLGQNDAKDLPADVRELATYRLGVCEFELGRLKKSAELFEEFVTSFSESPLLASASLFCGEALFKTARPKQAVEHFTRVVERFESDPAYQPSLLRLGEALAELQHWPRSEKAFADYLARFGDSDQWFQARFGIGWARENLKRFDEAITAYRDVVERHKGATAARAQFQIGECLFAQKNHDEAVREFLKVDILYAYPEWSAAALYEAGRCFEALGKPVEARQQFQAVAEKYKETRWAGPASKRLKSVKGGSIPGRDERNTGK